MSWGGTVFRRLRSNRVATQVPDAWIGMDDGIAGEDDDGTSRVVYAGPGAASIQQRFCGNDIHTAKYNVITFLPVFLFTMFSRVAYLYFLSQCALAYWSTVSPFTPYGPTIALAFVLAVAAVKAIVEDWKRHQEDHRTNNSIAHVILEDGSTKDVKWKDVVVGQVLEVRDTEDFPADLLCLATTRPDGVAYIRTTSLDGETNLKIRRPVTLMREVAATGAAAREVVGVLRCEGPNADLHGFVGKLSHRPSSGEVQVTGLSMEEMLLRGCTLQNTARVYGLAVYTGPETRIQRNAAPPPRKLGSYDGFLNIQVLLLLVGQVLLCLGCAVGSYVWRESEGNQRYYLATESSAQGNYQNGWAYVAVLFLTFWILYSYMIPISLFVTLEIIKFILSAIFITFDPHMKDKDRREYPRARNSDIAEDLGLVDYVFCDKTGTLTSNEMQLRQLTIKGESFGRTDFQLETCELGAGDNLAAFDTRLAQAAALLQERGAAQKLLAAGGSPAPVLALGSDSNLPEASNGDGRLLLLGHHLLDFWTAVSVCHSLLTEEGKTDGAPAYQGASPDEVALVEAGRRLGFEFVGRSREEVQLQLLGREVTHRILDSMEFTSQRARMSVVSRAPDGTIRLYSKGADSVMLSRLRSDQPPGLLAAANDALRQYSLQGLRTLLICSRVVSEEEWAAYSTKREAAASAMHGREEALEAVANSLECNYELLGVTAIEDKLQEGVPEAIRTLLAAGIKVWMITGDKQETAVNIGSSCGLIKAPDKLLLCNAPSSQGDAAAKLAELGARVSKGGSGEHELVLDGKTLGQLLGEEEQEMALAALAVSCSSVIVCRASPSQKAAVVLLMKRYHALLEAGGEKRGLSAVWQRIRIRLQMSLTGRHAGSSKRMLAIGDGANDVAMIQAAHIGVGILGFEGRQAANNSDFAVSHFRFLVRLLFVHGSLAVYRLARLIKYSFYKNVSFAFMFFFYQIFCGYSGQALLDGITTSFYNAFFTALPIGAFAIWDRPLRDMEILVHYPRCYRKVGRLNPRSFWKSGILQGIAHGAVVFFIPYYATATKGFNSNDDVFSVGKTMFIAMIGTVSWEIALISKYWTKLFIAAWSLSYLLTFPWLVLLPVFYQIFNSPDVSQYGVGLYLLGSPNFWLSIFLVYAITFSLRMAEKGIHTIWFPSDIEILAEHHALHKKQPAAVDQPPPATMEMQEVEPKYQA